MSEKRFGKGSRPEQTSDAKAIRELAEGQGGSVKPRELPEGVKPPEGEEVVDHAEGIADAIPLRDTSPPQAPPAPRATGQGGSYDPSKEDVEDIINRAGPREGRPNPPSGDERDTSGQFPKGSGVLPPASEERRT